MYACAADPKTSQCVTETTREADWVLESLQQLKMDLLHFVVANIVMILQESVMEHTVLYDREKLV